MSANCDNCRYMNYEDRNKYDEAYCRHLRKYTSLTGGCYSGVPRESGGCYLTTAMCHVLEYNDNCDTLEILRGYRDWYMWNDPKYQNLLDEYDEIGPLIAEKLLNDNHKSYIVNEMINTYIIPAVDFIFNRRYDEAAKSYIDMTLMLKDMYDLNKENKVKRYV